jgi:hypothetical protein
MVIEIDVPVASCGRCGKEAPFRPVEIVLNQTEAGFVYLVHRAMPPFTPLMIGSDTTVLCPDCSKLIRGALGAIGVIPLLTGPLP